MKLALYLAVGFAVAFAARKSWWGFWDWLFVVVLWWAYIAVCAVVLAVLAVGWLAGRAGSLARRALSGLDGWLRGGWSGGGGDDTSF